MRKLVIHRDSVDTLTCSISIRGVSSSVAKARLILDTNKRKLVFDGVVSNGKVTFIIPKLMDEVSDRGFASMEVIADSAYFEVWTSEFELVNKRSIEVEDITIVDEPIEVNVGGLDVLDNERELDEEPELLLEEELVEVLEDYLIENIDNEKTMNYFEATYEQFRSDVDWEPTIEIDAEIRTWVEEHFIDPETEFALYVMEDLQKDNQ